MKSTLVRLVACSALLIGTDASADSAPPEVSSRWGTPGRAVPRRILARDGRAFVLMGPSHTDLVILDVVERGDPSNTDDEPPWLDVRGRLYDLALSRSKALDPVTSLPVIRETVYLASQANDAEILVALAPPGGPISIQKEIDLPGNASARAMAAADGLVFVGRSASREQEFVILDEDGQILGGLDLLGRVDDIEVVGNVAIASDARLSFEIDVADPAQPVLLSTFPRPPRPDPPVHVKRTVDFAVDGPMAYLAVEERDAEVQEVNLRLPLNFEDVDGDGFRTLGCAGDSNTVPVQGLTKWCERLEDLVDDPSFRVINVASPGATAMPSSGSAYDQVARLLEPTVGTDAIVLSFGTNDTNLKHFDPDPALLEQQLDEIVMHLEIHHATIEATGRRAYVATAPPRWKMLYGPNGFNERVIGLNDRIARAFPAGDLIDHYEFFHADQSEITDGVHVNQRGQNKRAWRAFEALSRPRFAAQRTRFRHPIARKRTLPRIWR